MKQERPELAIVSREQWDAVAERRAAVRDTFTRSESGQPKGRIASGRTKGHARSGLLYCKCGAPFTVASSTNASYLSCSDSKRGRCEIRKSVREDIAEACVLRALRERLGRPEALAYTRKQLAARLADVAARRDGKAEEIRHRLAKAERRLANLIGLLADGDQSHALRGAARDQENQIDANRRAMRELERVAAGEEALPTVEEVLGQLESVLAAVKLDPVVAREALRCYFAEGRITMELCADGIYTGTPSCSRS